MGTPGPKRLDGVTRDYHCTTSNNDYDNGNYTGTTGADPERRRPLPRRRLSTSTFDFLREPTGYNFGDNSYGD